jgi:tetratricopeptide (TPR) repeat protein
LLKAEPENYSAWQEVGHVCRELGETDRMLAAYRKAADVAPQRWDAMLALVRAQEEAGQWDAAAFAYQRAVSLAGGSKRREQAAGIQAGRIIRGLETRRAVWLGVEVECWKTAAACADSSCDAERRFGGGR